MSRMRHSIFFRAIALAIIVSFIGLEIAYAYPPEHKAINAALSAPSPLQAKPIGGHAAKDIFFQSAITYSAYHIGKYFLDDAKGRLPKYADYVLDDELKAAFDLTGITSVDAAPVEDIVNNAAPSALKEALEKIGFNGTLPDKGAIVILYKKGNRKYLVLVARKDRVPSDDLPGYDLPALNKYENEYAAKYVPEDYDTPDTYWKRFCPIGDVIGRMNRIYYELGAESIIGKDFDTSVSCDSTTADSNARAFFEHLLKLKKEGALPDDKIIDVWEWGVGNGRYAADFLEYFRHMDEANPTAGFYKRLRYHIADLSGPMIDLIIDGMNGKREPKDRADEKIIESLRRHNNSGKIEFIKGFDAMDLSRLDSGSAMLIRHNELYDDLPGLEFIERRKDGKHFTINARLVLKRGAVFKTREGIEVSPDRFVNDYWPGGAAKLKELDSGFLEYIDIETKGTEIDISSHPHKDFILDFTKGFTDDVILPINNGALRNMEQAMRLLDSNGYMEFCDYGFMDEYTLQRTFLREINNIMWIKRGNITAFVNFAFLMYRLKTDKRFRGFDGEVMPQAGYISKVRQEEFINLYAIYDLRDKIRKVSGHIFRGLTLSDKVKKEAVNRIAFTDRYLNNREEGFKFWIKRRDLEEIFTGAGLTSAEAGQLVSNILDLHVDDLFYMKVWPVRREAPNEPEKYHFSSIEGLNNSMLQGFRLEVKVKPIRMNGSPDKILTVFLIDPADGMTAYFLQMRIFVNQGRICIDATDINEAPVPLALDLLSAMGIASEKALGAEYKITIQPFINKGLKDMLATLNIGMAEAGSGLLALDMKDIMEKAEKKSDETRKDSVSPGSGHDDLSHHFPKYIWKGIDGKPGLEEELKALAGGECTPDEVKEVCNRVLEGAGVARFNMIEGILKEDALLPIVTIVLNRILDRGPPMPEKPDRKPELTVEEVRAYLAYHEELHRAIRGILKANPDFISDLLDKLKGLKGRYKELKDGFVANYGEYEDELQFAEELLVVFMTETGLLHQLPKVLPQNAAHIKKGRVAIKYYIADILRGSEMAIIRSLADTKDPAGVGILVSLLNGKHSTVAETAARALGEIKDPRAIRALVDAIWHDDSHVRKASVGSLIRQGDPSSVAILVELAVKRGLIGDDIEAFPAIARSIKIDKEILADITALNPRLWMLYELFCNNEELFKGHPARKLLSLLKKQVIASPGMFRRIDLKIFDLSIESYLATGGVNSEEERRKEYDDIASLMSIVHGNLPACLGSIMSMGLRIRDIDELVRTLNINNALTSTLNLLGRRRNKGGYLTMIRPLVRAKKEGGKEGKKFDYLYPIILDIARAKGRSAPIEIENILEILRRSSNNKLVKWTETGWNRFRGDITAYYGLGFKALTPKFFSYFTENRDDAEALTEMKDRIDEEMKNIAWGGFFGFSDGFRDRYKLADRDEVALLTRYVTIINSSASSYEPYYRDVRDALNEKAPSLWQKEVPDSMRALYVFKGTATATIYEPEGQRSAEELSGFCEKSLSYYARDTGGAGLEDLLRAGNFTQNPMLLKKAVINSLLDGQPQEYRSYFSVIPTMADYDMRQWLSRWHTLICDGLKVDGRGRLLEKLKRLIEGAGMDFKDKEQLLTGLGFRWIDIGRETKLPRAGNAFKKLVNGRDGDALKNYIIANWMPHIHYDNLQDRGLLDGWLNRALKSSGGPKNMNSLSDEDKGFIADALNEARLESAGDLEKLGALRKQQIAQRLLDKSLKLFSDDIVQIERQLKNFKEEPIPSEVELYSGFFDDLLHLSGEFMTSGACTRDDRAGQIKRGAAEGYHFGTIALKDDSGKASAFSQAQLLKYPNKVLNLPENRREGHEYSVLSLTGINMAGEEIPIDTRKAVLAILQTAAEIKKKAGLQAAVLAVDEEIHSNQPVVKSVIADLVREGYLTKTELAQEVILSTGLNPFRYWEVYLIKDECDVELKEVTMKEITAKAEGDLHREPVGKEMGLSSDMAVEVDARSEEKKSHKADELFEIVESAMANRKRELTDADRAIARIITLARKAEREKQKLVIGLETDWMPGINSGIGYGSQRYAMNPILTEIRSIKEKLASLGINNVEIVCAEGQSLAKGLNDKIAEIEKASLTKVSLSNVIVMASQDTIASRDFAAYRRVEKGNKRAFLASIDTTKIMKYCETNKEPFYVGLAPMLYTTLELAVGREPPKSPIIEYYNREERRVIFLPEARKIEYQDLVNIHLGEKKALENA